ncbi:MAG: hypothetical protein HYR71_12230 [Chloroflexi bacterium]|nr:hypothetical protein [Chloroflexota bacterium]
MKQLLATVTAAEPLAAFHLLTISALDLPQLRAGQLMLARPRTAHLRESYLRVPLFPIPSITAPNTCSVLIVRGEEGWTAAETVARSQAGDELDIVAPVGNGFTLEGGARRVLLLGTPSWLAPLIALAREAAQKQVEVTLLVERGPYELAPVLDALLPVEVEYEIVANLADSLKPVLMWPDQICAAAPAETYRALWEQITPLGARARSAFAQAMLAPPMACGFGVCLSCAVEIAGHPRLACVDGPVFDWADLAL